MFKLLLFPVCWLIAFGSSGQAPPAAFPDTSTITENSVGKARIRMPVSELKSLYKTCTFTPTHLMQYGFDDTDAKPNGVAVSYGGQKLFVYFADWQTHRRVACLLAFHSAYKTVKGIRVGATSGQLAAAVPGVRVVPNMMLPVFQTAFAGKLEKPGLEYIFFKQKDLGNYVVADEPAKLVVRDAKISWIQVYPH